MKGIQISDEVGVYGKKIFTAKDVYKNKNNKSVFLYGLEYLYKSMWVKM